MELPERCKSTNKQIPNINGYVIRCQRHRGHDGDHRAKLLPLGTNIYGQAGKRPQRHVGTFVWTD